MRRFLDVVLACVDSSTQVIEPYPPLMTHPHFFILALTAALLALCVITRFVPSDCSCSGCGTHERRGSTAQERVWRGVQVRDEMQLAAVGSCGVRSDLRIIRKVALSRGASVQLTSFDNHVRSVSGR